MKSFCQWETSVNFQLEPSNNNVMVHEPKSTLEATQRVVKVLDAKYEKADLNAVLADNC